MFRTLDRNFALKLRSSQLRCIRSLRVDLGFLCALCDLAVSRRDEHRLSILCALRQLFLCFGCQNLLFGDLCVEYGERRLMFDGYSLTA